MATGMIARDPGVAAPPLLPDLRQWAILLDVDGTIVDLAPTPLDIHVPPSLCETLRRLNEKSAGALALVSGRTLHDLDQIFAPLRFAAIGGHGAEMRLAAGAPIRREPVYPIDLAMKRALAAVAQQEPGILIEDKGYSITLHYRLVPERGSFVRAAVAAICAEMNAQDLELLEGACVIEIKHKGYSKGSAVRKLMEHAPFAGRRPIFVGDDTTDQSAFAVMPHFGGLAISVRRRAAGVDFHFETPEQVRDWLDRVATVDEGAPA
jgi:trehalose 6-phosphate phosphatase